ncbi:hypothetical protein AXG93_115s1230 [Marchantia polymorpha subsp. ruderalis]|uniref:Uncharacterized protein n=1 Tax=Marchantia polymorpha subsp. ruderalis TaxID=1480154 RepID=A0A176W604_MARPO|nr:hypothetical protein AXG93_115s1230 [Marchantia polymorpha subsp. ruderalis]
MWTCLLYSDPTEEHMERTRMSAIAACTLLRNENDVLFCTETVSLWESMMATARNQSGTTDAEADLEIEMYGGTGTLISLDTKLAAESQV